MSNPFSKEELIELLKTNRKNKWIFRLSAAVSFIASIGMSTFGVLALLNSSTFLSVLIGLTECGLGIWNYVNFRSGLKLLEYTKNRIRELSDELSTREQ